MQPITPVVPGLDLPVTTFAKDQPQYRQLPSYLDPDGTVTTRWRLTDEERARVAQTGDIWLTQMTFNHPLQPVRLDTECPLQPISLLPALLAAARAHKSTPEERDEQIKSFAYGNVKLHNSAITREDIDRAFDALRAAGEI